MSTATQQKCPPLLVHSMLLLKDKACLLVISAGQGYTFQCAAECFWRCSPMTKNSLWVSLVQKPSLTMVHVAWSGRSASGVGEGWGEHQTVILPSLLLIVWYVLGVQIGSPVLQQEVHVKDASIDCTATAFDSHIMECRESIQIYKHMITGKCSGLS